MAAAVFAVLMRHHKVFNEMRPKMALVFYHLPRALRTTKQA